MSVSPAPSPAESPTPTSSVPPVSACPNESAVAQNDDLRLPGSLRGDIDGDGSADDISLHLDEDPPPSCRAFVVVDSEEGVAAASVWQNGTEGGLPEPSLYSLVEIDTRAGLEVVVNEAAGASTQFVGVFTFLDGELARIESADASSGVAGLFAFGGSVGHLDAVDCAQPGEVVVTTAFPGEGRAALNQGIYDVTRRIFVVSGTQLRPMSTERTRATIDYLAERFPEFAMSPFTSCPRP